MSNQRNKETVLVVCKKAGCPTVFAADVAVSKEEFDSGLHYELAESSADQEGFQRPFICFDSKNKGELVGWIGKVIHNNRMSIPFMFKDLEDHNDNVSGFVNIGVDGLGINFSGYSDFISDDDEGTPIVIECLDGNVGVYLFSDINDEDSTHDMFLDGAKNEARKPEVV